MYLFEAYGVEGGGGVGVAEVGEDDYFGIIRPWYGKGVDERTSVNCDPV